MMEAAKIPAVNDNVHLFEGGLEDRTGFNAFLKDVKLEKITKEEELLKQDVLESDNEPTNPALIWLKSNYPIFLRSITFVCLIGLIFVPSPALQTISLSALIVISIIISALSAMKGRERFHALGLFAAIAMSFGLMVMIGEYYAVTPLQISSDSLWVMAAGMSLAVGALLKSRVALIISITAVAIWGYGYLSETLSVSLAVFGFPIIAICQILLSNYLEDRVGKFASVIMLCVWAGIVLSVAYANNLLIVPMMLSGVILGLGAFYIFKSHMLGVWAPAQQKPTYPLVWLLLMGCTLLAALWFWSPDSFPTIGRKTPLTQAIWKAGIVGGGLLLLGVSLKRPSRQSYSFARRSMSSIVIMSIAAGLYYQGDIEARLGQELTAEFYTLIYTGTLGILAFLTATKFAIAIKNDDLLWFMVPCFVFFGVFFAATQVEIWSLEMITVSVLAAMVTACAIEWTKKDSTDASSIYRPLSAREKKRLGLTQKHNSEDVDMNIGQPS